MKCTILRNRVQIQVPRLRKPSVKLYRKTIIFVKKSLLRWKQQVHNFFVTYYSINGTINWFFLLVHQWRVGTGSPVDVGNCTVTDASLHSKKIGVLPNLKRFFTWAHGKIFLVLFKRGLVVNHFLATGIKFSYWTLTRNWVKDSVYRILGWIFFINSYKGFCT